MFPLSLSFRRISIDGNVSNEKCEQRSIAALHSSVSTHHARSYVHRSSNLIDQSLTRLSNAKLVKFYFSLHFCTVILLVYVTIRSNVPIYYFRARFYFLFFKCPVFRPSLPSS